MSLATVVFTCALAASALLLLAAWCDVATRTIPDSISCALAALGLSARAFDGFGAAGLSVLVAAALFAALLPLHARGAFGGADLKLVTALAIGFAPSTTLDFLFSTVMAGGALGLVYLLLRLLPRPSPLVPQPSAWPVRRVLTLERHRFNRRGPLPYAVAIAVGGIFTLMKPFGA